MTPIKMSYCKYCENLPDENLHKIYHDTKYGFKISSDEELFERFVLEINQAGLSWDLMLKKQAAFKIAFDHYNLSKIAEYSDDKIEELMQNASIIRNRLKIKAVIFNAQRVLELQTNFGSFKNWIETHHPLSKEEWVKVFKKTFKFTGGEIVNELLMSTGYLPGAHDENCKIPQLINSK